MHALDSGYLFDAKHENGMQIFGGRTPVPIRVEDKLITLVVGCYEQKNRTAIGLLKIEVEELSCGKLNFATHSLKYPYIKRGEKGTYSEWGIIPSCALTDENGGVLLYTIGFDSRNSHIFDASSGICKLNRNLEVKEIPKGPVLERGLDDPYWAASPFVIQLVEKNEYAMLYTSAIELSDDCGAASKEHHKYIIKARHSCDPYYFNPRADVIVEPGNPGEYAIARPSVLHLNHHYYLFYCKRETARSDDYMIFYRKAKKISELKNSSEQPLQIDVSHASFNTCQCYPYPLVYKDRVLIFYNGIEYGKTGFRIAVLSRMDLK